MAALRTVLFAFVFLALAPCAARADFTPEQQQAIKSVEGYLDAISTFKAHFVQTDNDGKEMGGTFYLKRPGKMRIDYDPPVTDFIVADGLLVYYYDGQTKRQSNAPIGKSLANFFLRKNLTLSGDISVSELKRDKGQMEVTLVQSKNPLAGSLTLLFNETPLQLLSWRVVDAQGLVTTVRLTNIESGNPLDSALFHYYDPAKKVFNNN
jgi:outer membrane lipoprotein-sorting protein